MAVEERIVDDQGRVYLSRSLRWRRLYMVRAGGIIVLALSRSEAVKAAELLSGNIIDEYLALLEKLGEPSPKEIEEASREQVWRHVREYL